MAGPPSTSQCIFQEELEIPGRLQQHQTTIAYLGHPYSSTVVSQIHTFLIFDTKPGSITLQYSCMLYLP